MEKFLKPEMEVVVFDKEDIMTSSPCPNYGGVTAGGSGQPAVGCWGIDDD